MRAVKLSCQESTTDRRQTAWGGTQEGGRRQLITSLCRKKGKSRASGDPVAEYVRAPSAGAGLPVPGQGTRPTCTKTNYTASKERKTFKRKEEITFLLWVLVKRALHTGCIFIWHTVAFGLFLPAVPSSMRPMVAAFQCVIFHGCYIYLTKLQMSEGARGERRIYSTFICSFSFLSPWPLEAWVLLFPQWLLRFKLPCVSRSWVSQK